MRMMDELKPLFLYSASKKVYIPIDEKDRRHNSAILLLTPNLEASSTLMKLPYIHNPNLFTSFYIDRNVMAYIGDRDISDIEIDEKEEESVSEAMLKNYNRRTKFKFDDNISIMDKKYTESVFNNSYVSYIYKLFRLTYTPEIIKIFVYPNVSALRDKAPSNIKNAYKDKLYSYSNKEEIHILSKLVYDPSVMGGSYDTYLKNELICNILMQANPDLAIIAVSAIAQVMSGMYDEKKRNDYSDIGTSECNKFAKSIKIIKDRNKIDVICRYIKTSDLTVFTQFAIGTAFNSLKKIVLEAEISYFDRQNLLPSEFGIPNKRKYPIHNEEHVKLAIKFFNNCDPSEERELAQNILKKIDRFGITDVKVSASNKFKPYYDEALRKSKDNKTTNKSKEKNASNIERYNSIKDKISSTKDKISSRMETILKREIAIMEGSFENSDYADILRICNHLSDSEFRRISFYDTYRDSKFVIKRIIKRENGVAAGFLDVYQFPSKPEIAQIVIAVANDYRGRGIADEMVKELLNSDLHSTHDFSMYYWTAHPENTASINLALKNGFKDMNHRDSYGRNVYLKKIKDVDTISMDDIPSYLKPLINTEAVITENSFVTSDMALLSEADNKMYSQKLKQYLYQERIKNNKSTIILYDTIKRMNPDIKRTYIKLDMYKRQNIFVDLSYYHELFLKNNTYRMDRAVNFYFDFLNRLIDNKEINNQYSKRTIFIPIDSGIWPIKPDTDIFDYKANLNPISIIFRLVRTNLQALRKAWGDKDIVFVGTRGYFKIDFKTIELKNLSRIKTNISKLMSATEIIEDEYDIDDIRDGTLDDEISTKKNVDSSKALTAKMVDKIEKGTSIQLNNISTKDKPIEVGMQHLQISKNNIDFGDKSNGIAIISLDPDGPDGFENISKTILANIGTINNYCMPK